MSARDRLTVILVVGSLYVGGFAFLTGMMAERIRFDAHRAAILAQLTTTEERLRARLIEIERDRRSVR